MEAAKENTSGHCPAQECPELARSIATEGEGDIATGMATLTISRQSQGSSHRSSLRQEHDHSQRTTERPGNTVAAELRHPESTRRVPTFKHIQTHPCQIDNSSHSLIRFEKILRKDKLKAFQEKRKMAQKWKNRHVTGMCLTEEDWENPIVECDENVDKMRMDAKRRRAFLF